MSAVLQASTGSPHAGRQRALGHALFGVLPAVITGWLLLYVASGRFGAVDFRQDFWIVGWRTLHGADPYTWTRGQIAAGVSFPYPALAALLFVPFALIPAGLSAAIFTAICLGAVLGAVRLVGPRDWRLYGVVALWPAVVSGWQTANLTLLLVFGVACVWRCRDRPVVSGVLVAVLVSLKPIVFPLGIWLIATRRYLAAGYAILSGAVMNLIAWSLIGWGGLAGWFHLLAVQGDLLYRKGYAIVALVGDLGLGRQSGTAVEVVVGIAAAGVCVWLARRGEDARSLAVATLLMLIASPQVDLHYFALLVIPMGVMRPRLRWSWLVPLILWVCPASEAVTWQVLLWWGVVAALAIDLLFTIAPGTSAHGRQLGPST